MNPVHFLMHNHAWKSLVMSSITVKNPNSSQEILICGLRSVYDMMNKITYDVHPMLGFQAIALLIIEANKCIATKGTIAGVKKTE